MSDFTPNKTSGDVPPGLPVDHLAYGNVADAKLTSERSLRHGARQAPDLNDIGAGELCGPGPLTFCHSASIYGVVGILGVCSENEMTRLHTTRPIARMPHNESVRHLSVVNTVREDVCSDLPALEPSLAITGTCESVGPVPASRFRNLSRHEVGEQPPHRETSWSELLERSSCEGVSELLHSSVVVVTQTPGEMFVGTPCYGAGPVLAGHSDIVPWFPGKECSNG